MLAAPGILIEEHGKYGVDCRAALWATDDIHTLYHACGLLLADADFAIETEENIILMEYKNANVPEAVSHRQNTKPYDPFEPKYFDKLVRKYYDSLHYLHLSGKNKPIVYVCVLEFPNGDSVSRKRLRNRLKKQLPFQLQSKLDTGICIISSVDVVDIDEWNTHELYRRYPIVPVS